MCHKTQSRAYIQHGKYSHSTLYTAAQIVNVMTNIHVLGYHKHGLRYKF